jgi:hypothetical protein
MDRNRLAAILAAVALVSFLLGFLPQWARANRTGDRLEETRSALDAARTEGKIAAALAESLRSNYERARQRMTEVYAEIEAMLPGVDERQRSELQAILAQRDEIITLLARAAPESSQRLLLIHTRYRGAMHPEPPTAPAAATPPS